MTTGRLAAAAAVNVQTIRYYERRGLVAPAARTRGGYRQYPPDAVVRLRFIKHAQTLGFSLDEIQDLLALRVRHAAACTPVARATRAKLAVVEEKIAGLLRMKRTLTRLVAACAARRPTADCPILETLEDGHVVTAS